MFKIVYFEISGICNANCPWCGTGNRSSKDYSSKFVDLDQFRLAIAKMRESHLIDSNTIIYLFNKGEPTLHPNFLDILKILSDNNLKFAISTNGSKFIEIPNQIQNNLLMIRISMPGFSQRSYDRIHGFNFNKILQNINKWISNINPSKIELCYHIYQFNLEEIDAAKNFCKEKGIKIFTEYAWIIDFQLSIGYLNGTIDKKILYQASKDLFFHYLDDLLKKCPSDYQCPEFETLAIDEFCNVLTCCGVLKNCPNYSLGSLFDLSKDEIEKNKSSQAICLNCLKLGRAFWVHNPCTPNF